MNKILQLALIVLVLPPLAAFGALVLLLFVVEGIALRLWFWCAHVSRGRCVLFVYSNSPNWQSYIETNILPRIHDKAVILNWSERRTWWKTSPCQARFFRHFAGTSDFNPIAIVFRRGRIRTIRLYRAFRDYKHGNTSALQAAETLLYDLTRSEPISDS